MFPFGREEESSLEELFSFFKRCLKHGEWELAAACVPQLGRAPGGVARELRDIIWAMVKHPYPLAWGKMGSPHKLAWFWMLVLEDWTKEKVPEAVRTELDFMLVLEELGDDVPEKVLKEFQQAFWDSRAEKKMSVPSAEVQECVRDLLRQGKPRLAEALVSFLLRGSEGSGSLWDHSLQDVFIQHLLEKLQESPSEALAEEVASVLALMPWSAERPKTELEGLWEALWRAKEGSLNEDRVLSSLLRPKDHTLVTLYSSASLRLLREQILREAPHTEEELPEAEKLMLGLCCHGDRPTAWKAIYFECLSSGKHFLEQVLVTGLDLVKRQEFGRLAEMLRGEFQPLARLLLLLGWPQCPSVASARTLLQVLHHQQSPASDAVLSEFADSLDSQLGVLEWCAKNNPDVSEEVLQAQLLTLGQHSALYLLHSLTPLARYDERKVLDLLHSLSPSGYTEFSDLRDARSLAAQRNITLFQGFCAMKYALYAICVNAHAHTDCKECGLQQPKSPGSQEENEMFSFSEEPEKLFHHYLSECQLYLEAVPALFRLELLENIFSLLFLSSADLSSGTEQKPSGQTPGDAESGNTQNKGIGETAENRETPDANAPPCQQEKAKETEKGAGEPYQTHLDLDHLTRGCRGFLADVQTMEGFLRLLREGLEGLNSPASGQDVHGAVAAESLGCSVTAESFEPRLQRLSKRTAEAQWRLQVVSKNYSGGDTDSLQMPSPLASPALSVRHSNSSNSSTSRRRRRLGRHRPEKLHLPANKQNGDFSASTSDGSGGAVLGRPDQEACPCGGPHSWLVPAMLAPPESLLVSCIRRGNFMEAHQVMLMFGLESSSCAGELVFMERYQEVLLELAQVEQKIESQSLSSSSSSEGLGAVAAPGRSRLGSSGRSTLQAIGNAAAAGMAFYSISDVAERLTSSPQRPIPALEEDYWLSQLPASPVGSPDPSSPIRRLLEELSPPAMAAFDLAVCHSQLWKSSRQLLETAERRLHASLEARGLRLDPKVPHVDGIRGFPAVLQQMSKILNRAATGKGPAKGEGAGEEVTLGSPFGCSAQEVLLSCHPTLTEEAISSRLSLGQRLEQIAQVLTTAADATAESQSCSTLLAALVEQASLKQSELEAHPVRSAMKQLLRVLDQLCPFEPDTTTCRPDYVRTFLDYVNTLASVLVRSMGSEADQTAEVKLGNPLLVLQQSPSQLLSYLLFERQVSAERLSSLLQQEGLGLSVEQVMVQHCCEPLPLWVNGRCKESEEGGAFSPARIAVLLQAHAQKHNLILDLPPCLCSELGSQESSDCSTEDARASSSGNLSPSTSFSSSSSAFSSSSASSSPSSSFLLTPSALAFLKSRSPLLAVLACLSATRSGVVRPSSGWPNLPSYFRPGGRKEAPLDGEQISREAQALLQNFPILRAYMHTMAEPVLGAPPSLDQEAEGNQEGLGADLCGTPLVALILSGPQSAAAQALVVEAFQQALIAGELERALRLLELYGQGGEQQDALRDQLLACAAQGAGEHGWEHLFRVRDTNLQARLALQVLDQWPLGACRELLEYCLSKSNMDASLQNQLQKKKQELDMYHTMLSLETPLPWETWQELREKSKKDPEAVMALLLKSREFELCAQWVQLYPVSEQSRLQLQTEHLLHLLEKGLTDEACQLLEGLPDSSRGLEVCERALDRQPTLAACHFLSDYLTVHFESRVSPARRRHIHALHLGSKVLLTLPEASRLDYFPLLSAPLLMLEQLLMNLKVEWADVAVRTLRNLLLGQEAGFNNEDIDKLLSNYGQKALEFSCAPRQMSRSDSVMSLQDAYLQCPAQDTCFVSPSVTPPPSAGSTPVHTPSSSGSRERSSISRRVLTPATPFTPPPKPPVRKDWIPDHQEPVCMVCRRERFSMFNRRHHCRRCGRLVCDACSSHRMAIEGCDGEEQVRVCDQCYSFFHPDSDDELEQAELASSPVAAQSALEEVVRLPEVPERQFRLSINPADNQKLLSEFYYEQAPSASLCVSILSLHSDPEACGHQLIGHCRSLSRTLTNPEVDARLITDVMRQLLFSAKVMFVKTGQTQNLELCDSYISKVDVLGILVKANYKYIPSLDDILEAAAVSRLRNQLLESEYYQLAVEVSTKSGLDPAGVWHAWGMACLKVGFLSGAREKFARCLKPPVDRSQSIHGPRILQEILQHLEANIRRTSVPMPQNAEEDILASLKELEEALAEPNPLERLEGRVQNCRNYQESLHYLEAYGTHLALVSFYMRHDGMKEALTHLLSKECPEDVFLEVVLMPSLERGRLGMLQTQLEALDPTLEGCSRYLIAACQLLQRRGHFHTLYQLQQFMTDHVRAAMTCIRFFTHGAQSYLQLGEQQRWLVRAKEHLKTYLQEQQGRGTGRKKSLSGSFRKKMSASDVSRHMNTIELQLEVTRFLHRCETSSPSKSSGTPTPASTGKASAPPTLFGGGPMKIDVACKVMLGGKNIEEGFGIAYRVIQDFQLEALAVYVRAGQRLVRQRQYGAVRQLLKCVGESGTATKNDCDAIVLNCISLADKAPADAKELEALILECKSTENKIKAYLQCSKLRAAYLLAVKLEPGRAGPLVQEVLQAAESSGDSVMENICRQWLTEHQDRPTRQRQGRPSAR